MKRVAPTDTHHTHPVSHPNARTALEERVEAVAAPYLEPPSEIVDHIAFYLSSKYLRTLCCVNTLWRQCAIAHFQGRIEGRLSELEDLVSFLGEIWPEHGWGYEQYQEHQEKLQWMRQANSVRLTITFDYKFLICNEILEAIDMRIHQEHAERSLSREDFLITSSPKVQSVIQQFVEFGYFQASPNILFPPRQTEKYLYAKKVLSYWFNELDWDELNADEISKLFSIIERTEDYQDSLKTMIPQLARPEIGMAPIYQAVEKLLRWHSDKNHDPLLKGICLSWPHKSLPELKQDLFPLLELMEDDDFLTPTLSGLLSRYPDLTVETLLALVSTDTHPNVKEIALQEGCCMKAKALDFESAFAILPHIQSPDIFQRAGSWILSAAIECQDIARVIQAAELLTPKNRNKELMLFCHQLINDHKLESIESLLLLIDNPAKVQRVRKWLEEPPVNPDQIDPQ